jgi:uncharacterized protein YndB with AHSA1/START domain
MELKFKVFGIIKKPLNEVFDAVYNPDKLSGYFTTGGSSGPLDEGKSVTWDFADFPGAFPVHVKQTILNEKIVLEWSSASGNFNTTVELNFKKLNSTSTLVEISESGWKEDNQKNLDESYSHCMGWQQMICCLKVYTEHGFNLREGFFK